MREADVIVVGAGAGARVLLLERNLAGPSNLRGSGSLFPGAGTRWQEAGIGDNAAAFAATGILR